MDYKGGLWLRSSDARRRCGSPSFPISTFCADEPQFLQLPHDRRLDQRAIACARAEPGELGQPLRLGSRHAAFNGRPFCLQRRQLRLETVYSGNVTRCSVRVIDLCLGSRLQGNGVSTANLRKNSEREGYLRSRETELRGQRSLNSARCHSSVSAVGTPTVLPPSRGY
jgi:hypothetical protein